MLVLLRLLRRRQPRADGAVLVTRAPLAYAEEQDGKVMVGVMVATYPYNFIITENCVVTDKDGIIIANTAGQGAAWLQLDEATVRALYDALLKCRMWDHAMSDAGGVA